MLGANTAAFSANISCWIPIQIFFAQSNIFIKTKIINIKILTGYALRVVKRYKKLELSRNPGRAKVKKNVLFSLKCRETT